MIGESRQKRSGSFFASVIICCVLSITAWAAGCSRVVSVKDLAGTWRAETILPNGIRVQSCYLVDQNGGYILYLTNYISGQKRTATVAGMLSISNSLLIDTITNAGNTLVPRVGGVWKIVNFTPSRLSLIDTNSTDGVDYLRDLKK